MNYSFSIVINDSF